jgi:1-acyl-sn-glycerol-3-phosphate acyltransferase
MLKDLQVALFSISTFCYIIICPFLPEAIHSTIMHFFVLYLRITCNVKVYIHGNEQLLHGKHIFMANHYEGVDQIALYPVITQPFNDPCYVIGKDDLLGKKYPLDSINSIIDYIIKIFYEGCNIIPYTRGNKESGIRVRKEAMKMLNNNKKLLIFPEGRSWRKGACHEFKPGMFEVAEQCNKSIVPITLKYRNFDGKNKGEKCVLQDWMNIDVDIFIHDLVLPKHHNLMLQETFEKITSKN